MYKKVSQELLQFINESPTSFHAVDQIRNRLIQNGYRELYENEKWDIHFKGKYFVIRNQSSIIAFQVGSDIENYHFQIVSSHSDSPTFKVKNQAEVEVKEHYTQLNTEGYGGMIHSSWLDRPLSIAGRAVVKKGQEIKSHLVSFDRDLVLIPNVSIHMNRQINDGFVYNKQIDMLPLFSEGTDEKNLLKSLIAKELNMKKEDIYSHDLYLYNRTHPSIWGAHEEFISSSRLDDLQCAYASLQAFLNSECKHHINILACFDNEEVGSYTKQGAGSTFLYDVLTRINKLFHKNEEDYQCAIASSFMISTDNAHAVHPNHPEKTDIKNCVYMNEGIVIKYHAGQRYTTDAISHALFEDICQKAKVPVQFFANRSDQMSGGTLGNIAMSHVSMPCVDIGLPQLAMHSSYETAGIKDTFYLIQALKEFYSSSLYLKENSYYIEKDC